QSPGHSERIRRPPAQVLGTQVIEVELDHALGEGARYVHQAVAAPTEREHRSAVDGKGQHESVVVVGVLADEVDATGARPHALGLVAVGCAERLANQVAQVVAHSLAIPSRTSCAVTSGTTSPIQAPIAASEPARYLSLFLLLRGEVNCSIRRISSRFTFTGAWCQAAM